MKTSLALAVVLALAPLAVHAQAPYLVKDINTTVNTDPHSSLPDGFFRLGSRVYFAARELGKRGRELWSTDGTPAGTALVADIVPGITSSYPSHFAALNGKLVFNAYDEAHSEELWISDGTSAGTHLVADIAPGISRSSPGDRIAYHGKLLFSAEENLSGRELWITDGTATGTTQLKDIVPGANGSDPGWFAIFNDTVYFSAANNLWKSDGTAAGTVQVKAIGGFGPYDLVVAGPRLFFATGNGVWVSDGTDAGTQKLIDANGVYVGTLTPFGNKVLFGAQVNGVGSQFWISDGTAAGTHLLRDIGVGAVRSVPFITAAGSVAFFTAWTSANGQELWKTDGTEAGTVMVKDIAPGSQDSTPFGIVAVGDKVYFAASTTTGGAKTLWVSDGTAAGTQPVRSDVAVSVDYSDPAPQIVGIGGAVYFGGANGLNGFEPWVSDGTAAGTRMLANISSDDAPSSFPKHLVAAGDRVFFDAWDGSGTADPNFGPPHQLWSSDGTEPGTRKLADVTAATTWTPSGRVVYFTKGTELWTSDGTAEGTGPATELASRFPSKPSSVSVAGDRIFANIGNSLWATSAAAGSPAVALNVPSAYTFVDAGGPTMFFVSSQLWITDGTAAGTMPVVRDVGGSPYATLFANGNVWFFAGLKLWKSDGTFEGTVLLKTLSDNFAATSLTAAGKNIFFVAGSGQLWVSDGTDAGTHALTAVPREGKIAAAGDRVVFAVGASASVAQLWVSDGTDAGTHLLRDSGPSVNFPIELASIAGVVYFSGYDSIYGTELWVTDGTADGTKLAADVEPGSGWGYPTSFVRAGDRVFFAATTTAAGTELYALPLASTPRLRVEDVRVAEGDGGTTVARFTVTLSSAPATSVTVDYATSDGTATAGSDYDAASGTLTFAPGETSKRIDVIVHGDTAPENNENFFVTLRNAAGARLEKAMAAAVIADDDQFADVGLALNFLQFDRAVDVVNVTNAGPRTATGVRVTGTVTPEGFPINCFPCTPEVAPGASVFAFQIGGTPAFQEYFTATVSAAQRDPQPSNNSAGWTANNSVAMDALYLAPGGQGNVFAGGVTLSVNASVVSSDPSVLTVPSSLAITAGKTATFVAHAVAPGTATITISSGAVTIGTLSVNVVAPGAKVRWPGAFRFFVDNVVAFDRPATVTIETGGRAPFSGLLATGLVTVSENGRELGRLTLTQAPAQRWTLPVYVTDLGANTLTVSYAGDDNFLPSTGLWGTTATTGAATIAATPDRLGTNATVHVTVTGSPAAAPTGTITLGEAGVIATKQATLTASPVAGVAQADVVLTNVTPGVHTLLISYSGDNRYRAGTQNVRMPEPKGRAVRH